MPCNDYLTFKKADHYGKPDITRNIEVNLKHYFDWAFLKIGAWENVDSSSSGVYGGNFYTLRHVDDEGYNDYTVYESIKKDWIYETGINYQSMAVPISSIDYNAAESQNQVFTDYSHNFSSGDSVTISNNPTYNGTFGVLGSSGAESFYIDLAESSGSAAGGSVYGTYNPITPIIYSGGTPYNTGSYTINYPLGRVIFDSSQSGVTVTADYSYRSVQVYLSDDKPWFYEIQFDSRNPSNLHWTQNITSGDFSVAAQNRIQMPAIVIQDAGNKRSDPYEMGGISNIVMQNFSLNVIAETKYERDNIVSILSDQQDSSIWLYDEAAINLYSIYSLNYDGNKNPDGLNYPGFVNNSLYRYKKARIDNVVTNNIKRITPSLYVGNVVWRIKLIA